MEQLSAIAFGLSLFGGVLDLLTRKIPNWFTGPAMLAGICAQFYFGGLGGVADGILGLLLGFALFFPVFAFGYMGGGDVKLLMVVGAWTGWGFNLWAAGFSVALGGVYAFFEILFRGRILIVFTRGYKFLRSLLLPALEPEPLNLDKNRKFAFGIFVAMGVALTIYFKHQGRIL